jgi:hypothetical protein
VIFIKTDYTEAGKMFPFSTVQQKIETNKLRLKSFSSALLRHDAFEHFSPGVFMSWKGEACNIKEYPMQETHFLGSSLNE